MSSLLFQRANVEGGRRQGGTLRITKIFGMKFQEITRMCLSAITVSAMGGLRGVPTSWEFFFKGRDIPAGHCSCNGSSVICWFISQKCSCIFYTLASLWILHSKQTTINKQIRLPNLSKNYHLHYSKSRFYLLKLTQLCHNCQKKTYH